LSEKFSAGLQFNLHTIRLGENYGARTGFSVDGGFLYQMNEKVSIAGHISNPTRAKIADFNDERLPTIIRAGAGYRFSKKVILTAEVRKASDADASVRVGLEYQLADPFVLRAGFGTGPSQYAFGFGWRTKYFQLDVASGYHLVLGFSPQISLTYRLVKN
jgi:long-subunit fatty acid transport protein